MLTLALRRTDREADHVHIDVADPADASVIMRIVDDAAGRPIPAQIAPFDGEWHCAECDAWRIDRDELMALTPS